MEQTFLDAEMGLMSAFDYYSWMYFCTLKKE